MRKLIILVVALGLMLSGCMGGKGGQEVEQPKPDPCYVGAPAWVLTPDVEGGIAASGSSKINKALGTGFAKTEALAAARDELARQISVKVKNMFKNFTQVTGVGDEQTVDRLSSNVSKQVANQTLNGSKQKAAWVSPCGELHVLVVIDPNAATDAVKEKTLSSLRNEKALWQQFLAKKAQDDLDSEINKEFGDKQQ